MSRVLLSAKVPTRVGRWAPLVMKSHANKSGAHRLRGMNETKLPARPCSMSDESRALGSIWITAEQIRDLLHLAAVPC